MEPQTLAIIALVINIIMGIIFCFFGNRWLKVIVAVYGFALGFMLAYSLLPMFTSLSSLIVLLISLGAGIVFALLFVLLLYVGIFFIGFGAGVILCLLIVDVFNLNLFDWYVYVPALIVACILGTLTINFRRIFVSIFTAFIGASALATAVYAFVYGISAQSLASYSSPQTMGAVYTSLEYLVSLAVFFVAGLVVQLAVTSKKEGRRRPKRA